MTTYSESYWKRREEADEERSPLGMLDAREPEVESVESARTDAAPAVVDNAPELFDAEIGEPAQSLAGKPMFGPVEPPPPVPPDVAPPPPGPPEFEAFAPPKPDAPENDNKAQKLEAIRRIRELGESSLEAPEGLRDADLAAASKRDRDSVKRANLSETIAAAFARRPARLQQEPSESDDLLKRRHMADAKAGQSLSRKMTAEEKIAAVLKGEKVDGMTPYQVEQIKRNSVLDAQRREDKTEADKRHEQERGENLKWRETTHNDAVAQQKATLKLAESQFGYKKGHDVDEDVKDLGKTLGDDPVRMMGLVEKLEADSKTPDIPGVGPLDRLKPDLLAGDEGLRIRNDMREAVRAMLTMKSGKTVTPQEAADYAKIYGIEGTEQAFREGVKRLRTDMAQTIATKKAGFRPGVVETYEERGGAKTPALPSPTEPKRTPPKGLPPNALWHKGAWWYEDGGVMVRHAEKPR